MEANRMLATVLVHSADVAAAAAGTVTVAQGGAHAALARELRGSHLPRTNCQEQ